ncbi:nucleoside phosphorylase [Marixanthomonas sp. SCSIO 43207]|uniref:nucleoside phosphorylase n=1 Tax=Marixanthomonas sp. SCSIO 43207 TaxID=2779360 RepID=UPI001CA907E0|nr:nucleoside phosphorylase [Marixanthomonas sp. SCSIO 43207]UAB80564.1 nucleoside phosphorylase [Marixanthomonas sp. SCSIO 43207]
MRIAESELIINPDGSIYHLHLKPEDLAKTIITVGDPERVESISKHFDALEVDVHNREFKTHTGTYNGKRISVISTGIGTDNIDIVFNELDALVNIDFEKRTQKDVLTQLTIVRVGTSGAVQPNIPIDSFLISETAIGFDNLLHFYANTSFENKPFSEAFIKHTNWSTKKSAPYVINADQSLLNLFSENDYINGVTATNVGFYGPQGRVLRLPLQDADLNEKLTSFSFEGKKITNLEMETSGIYAMAKLLGHKALSLNAILANRPNGTFSNTPKETVETLIKQTLEILTK